MAVFFSRVAALRAAVPLGALLIAGCQSGATIGSGPGTIRTTPTPVSSLAPGQSPTPAHTATPGVTPTPGITATPAPPFTTPSPGTTPTPVPSAANLAKIACAGAPPDVSGTNPNFTQVGPSGVYTVIPEDASGNPVAATLTFAPMSASQGATKAGSASNQFLATVNVLNTAVPFVARGTNAAGTVVTQTCNITRVEALYVANRATNAGQNGTNLPSSVTIYPASANGNATPIATIAGSNADTIETEFVAVDNNGYIFASNQGPMPGQTYSPTTSGYVAIYAPNSTGNVAPVAMIPNLGRPEGLAFDTMGDLWVMTLNAIYEYAPSANGLGGPASPMNTIAGSQTGLDVCYGITLDASNNIYDACTNTAVAGDFIGIFPAGSTGNVKPTMIMPSADNGTTYDSRSWLSVAVDTSGNMFAPASNQNLNMVDEYAPGASGTPVPSSEIASTSFSQPIDIQIDPSASFFLSNLGNNSVVSFSSATVFQTGIASTTLTGANTGLNQPFGIFVK